MEKPFFFFISLWFLYRKFHFKSYHCKELQNSIMIENENAIRRNAIAEIRQFFRCIRSCWKRIKTKKSDDFKQNNFDWFLKSFNNSICCATVIV